MAFTFLGFDCELIHISTTAKTTTSTQTGDSNTTLITTEATTTTKTSTITTTTTTTNLPQSTTTTTTATYPTTTSSKNSEECEGNIRRQRINLETPTKQRCLDLQSTKWCDGVCLSSHPRLLRPNEVDLENSGLCPSAVESCPVHSRSKKSCLNKGCSWCDGKCRDPNAVLNEECASLIVCNPHADKESCPAGCEWVPLESKKCNDPTFSGCFVKEEACRGNIRRQRINVENPERCFELDNTKWCDGVCLATNPRLLRPNEVTKIISSENK